MENKTGEVRKLSGYDDMSDEFKESLTPELRTVFHGIKNEIQLMRNSLDLYKETSERKSSLNSQRIDLLDKLVTEHVQACNENRKEMKEVLDGVRTIKAGMRFTTFVRNFFISIAGVITTGYGLFQLFKGWFQ